MSDVTWGLVGRRLWALVRWQYWPTMRRAWRRDVRGLRHRARRLLGPAPVKRRHIVPLTEQSNPYTAVWPGSVVTTTSLLIAAEAMARDNIAKSLLSTHRFVAPMSPLGASTGLEYDGVRIQELPYDERLALAQQAKTKEEYVAMMCERAKAKAQNRVVRPAGRAEWEDLNEIYPH